MAGKPAKGFDQCLEALGHAVHLHRCRALALIVPVRRQHHYRLLQRQREITRASLTEAEVTDIRAHVERDDRRTHWEVRWRSGDWVYDFDIDPDTGAILEWDRDREPAPKTNEPTEPAPAQELTREEAQAIALAHAGFTADQVTGLRTHRDKDDRTPTYEIEFRVGRTEYEYELHAETGRILDFDRDN